MMSLARRYWLIPIGSRGFSGPGVSGVDVGLTASGHNLLDRGRGA